MVTKVSTTENRLPLPVPITHAVLQQQAARIAMVWRVCIDVILNFLLRISHFVFNHQMQRYTLQQLRLRIANPESTWIETLYFKDLQSQVGLLGRGVDPTPLLLSIDETTVRWQALITRAKEGVDAIRGRLSDVLLDEADALYRECMEKQVELKGLPGTEVQRALYSGRLTTLFRELDNAFSDQTGIMLHRYCGCHIEGDFSSKDLKKLAPTLKKNYEKFIVKQPPSLVQKGMPKHPSVALLSQSLGGGHNVVQHAMSQRLAEQGGHAYRIEADEEVLDPYYQFKKWTGKTAAEWSQFLLQGNYFRTIRFLGWLSSGGKRPTEELVHQFTLSLLARGQQDLAMMVFTRHAAGAERAASRLGMGFADIATDLDFEVFGFSEGAQNPHFRHFLMARDAGLEAEGGIGRVLSSEQIIEGGFPVRESFLKKYSPEELTDIRAEHREKYGLPDDARVVILLCGGAGIENQFAETLVKRYSKESRAPKIHLFAVCGNNSRKKEKLEKLFASSKNEKMTASAIGLASDIELGELFAMATFEKEKGLLISAKAGGGTVSEAVARGIPFLVCDQSKVIKHEGMNLKFVTQNDLGRTFSRYIQLPAQVVEMLHNPPQPKIDYANFDSKEKSLRAIGALITECREDPLFQEQQQTAFNRPMLQSPLQAPAPLDEILQASSPPPLVRTCRQEAESLVPPNEMQLCPV